ncbi:3-hydroxyacyl-ACP dehydratase FabZ [Lysinibacillus capsici]|uniref:3-hydroxyacyl-ACP dehydratase FabZ n=1 Tax=Lysinibacillus capsici TaxID=2115968 RepID=UPI002E1B9149|nr:3-hydroxyacyl-ACP dehydratase FabZ [Lysinibacillus capsici]
MIEITTVLPHKYPFLLADRIVEMEYMKHSKGYKHISNNEPWVNGHFADKPIYPGVLMIETMVQIGGFMFIDSNNSTFEKKMYLCGVKNFKIIHPVIPGDTLMVEAEFVQNIAHFFQIKCTASVDGKIVASGVFSLAESKE